MFQVILTRPLHKTTISFKFNSLAQAMNFADDKLNRLVDVIEEVAFGEFVSLLD